MDNKEIINDELLRQFAEHKIEVLREELKKWYSVLNALESSTGNQVELFKEEKIKSTPKALPFKLKEKPQTLREKCERILYDINEPLTTRDLRNELEKKFKDHYSFSSFSGSFSQAYRRKSSFIRKYNLPHPTNDVKVVYGLKHWFHPVTKTMGDEYYQKVKDRYNVE